MLILLFCLQAITSFDIDKTKGKQIKIFFSGYPSTILGLSSIENKLLARNKYTISKDDKFIFTAQILPKNNKYTIKFNDTFICRKGAIVVPCEKPGEWSITPKPFGFTIGSGRKCMTKDVEDAIKMKECVGTEDQLLSLKPIIDGDCEEEEDKRPQVRLNVIPLVNKRGKKTKIKVDKSENPQDELKVRINDGKESDESFSIDTSLKQEKDDVTSNELSIYDAV